MQAARGAPLSSDPEVVPSRRRRRALRFFTITAVSGYVLDQVTKALAEARLEQGERLAVLGDVLGLTLVHNPGAAFGLGTHLTPVLTMVAVVAAVVVLAVALRLRDATWGWGLGLLLAGVLGNLTDRLVRAPGVFEGHVVDFLELPRWPVFNVADVCINLAAVIVLVQAFRGVRVDGGRVAPPTGGSDDATGEVR